MSAEGVPRAEVVREELFVRIGDHDRDEIISKVVCQWRYSTQAQPNTPPYFSTFDLTLNIHPSFKKNKEQTESGSLAQLVQACCGESAAVDHALDIAAKIVLVGRTGFLCRHDILERRMQDSEVFDRIIPLGSKGDCYRLVQRDNVEPYTLCKLMSYSAAAMLTRVRPGSSSDEWSRWSEACERDLDNRLSFEWILPNSPLPKLMAMIGGRTMFDAAKMSFCSSGPIQAAEALNISVLVVDRPGHWMEDDAYNHLRNEFVAIDMTINDGLTSRIVSALQNKNIDGIITFSDEYLEATAHAAEALRLPSDPSSAFLLSTNKYATRKMADLHCPAQSLLIADPKQFDQHSTLLDLAKLEFPVVVKPCRGGGSRGVSKANNVLELRHAVDAIEKDGYAGRGIIVETYADGPEVDANFTMWNGKILFFEMSDDFPALADKQDATVSSDFNDDFNILPSALDNVEQDLVRSRLHSILLLLGFRSGIFHVEARVQGSSKTYVESSGLVDLAHRTLDPKDVQSLGQPKVFLIEVNARPPGPDCVFGTALTYGVDYNALQWLRGLGDGHRFAALCHPYGCNDNNAQYCCSVMSIPIHRKDVYVPNDFCSEVLRRVPSTSLYVAKAECFVPGKTISPVGNAGFLAYFLVFSRRGRRDLLMMCRGIKETAQSYLDSVLE